jgi:hypothetical protein
MAPGDQETVKCRSTLADLNVWGYVCAISGARELQ